ncbi:MAG: hypothetical protein MZU79_02970 [Anaerotruncus sp.]|nr:hypothetical protein [Anaerotruncus sp.]
MAASDVTSTRKAPVHTIESRLLTALLLLLQARAALFAENLFLRKQLASKYLDKLRPGDRRALELALATFVGNHARGIVACDFMVTVTASMRLLCIFVAVEVGSRRILHTNVTAHLTAEWTLQQFR